MANSGWKTVANKGATGKTKTMPVKWAKALADLEAEIHSLEQTLSRLENDLAQAGQAQDVSEIQRLGEEYTVTQHRLEQSMEAWAAMAERVEA